MYLARRGHRMTIQAPARVCGAVDYSRFFFVNFKCQAVDIQMRLTLFASFLLALGCCRHTEARQDVPGPGFPPLKEIKPAAVVALQEKLNTVIEDISKEGKQNGNSNFESSSFALQVTSAIGTLWSAYHTGAKIGNGTTHVGGDTVFRIASISKTFTVYALLLQESIHLDDVVTKFLPELMDREERDGLVSWDRITVRSLASQLSGIPRDSKTL